MGNKDEQATGEEMALFAIADDGLRDVQSYAERGRAYRTRSALELDALFVDSMRKCAADSFANPDVQLANRDVLAEYELRGTQPPYRSVMAEVMYMSEKVRTAVEKIGKKRWSDLEADVRVQCERIRS
jgi:hypothetical protein